MKYGGKTHLYKVQLLGSTASDEDDHRDAAG